MFCSRVSSLSINEDINVRSCESLSFEDFSGTASSTVKLASASEIEYGSSSSLSARPPRDAARARSDAKDSFLARSRSLTVVRLLAIAAVSFPVWP